MADTPIYSLYEAEKQGHAKFLWAVGDGSTIHLRLTMRNLRNYPIIVRIDPGTHLSPNDRSYQEMAVIRPAEIHLKPMETRSVWVNTACLRAERRAPACANAEQASERREKLRAQIAEYLRSQGLQARVDDLTEDHEDGLKPRLQDLERMGQALDYTPARISEIYDEIQDICQRVPPGIHMGYRLAPLEPEAAEWLDCITHAVEELDSDIARDAEFADQPVSDLIREFGSKQIVLLLAQTGATLDKLRSTQFFIHLDSALANIFRSSGHRFKPLEALRLAEFDEQNDQESKWKPRLNSITIQYAIWAITNRYNLDQCCRTIKRSGREAVIQGAGVRSVLHRAAQVARTRKLSTRFLELKIPLFSQSILLRFIAKVGQWF